MSYDCTLLLLQYFTDAITGTCESFFFVRIESRIESAVRFVFESNIRIESSYQSLLSIILTII